MVFGRCVTLLSPWFSEPSPWPSLLAVISASVSSLLVGPFFDFLNNPENREFRFRSGLSSNLFWMRDWSSALVPLSDRADRLSATASAWRSHFLYAAILP